MFVPHASEIWTKLYGLNYPKLWALWQKKKKKKKRQKKKKKKKKKEKKNRVFKNHFWQSVDAILEDVSVVETIV